VAYVDIDPVAVAHSKSILAGNPAAGVIQADLRDPGEIVASPGLRHLMDFREPVAVLLAAVLHFLPDEDDPWRLVGTLRDAMAPGSYLVVSHATREGMPAADEAALRKLYQGQVQGRSVLRSRAGIERFFEGFDLVQPGVVGLSQWRPDTPAGKAGGTPPQLLALAGVGRKP
jgi:hypothetical protein